MRYVAFLRGINLGKRRLKMDRLAEEIEAAGMADVNTFLASGNVIFSSDQAEDGVVIGIEGRLRESLGYEVDTFVRTMDELQEVADRDVFADADKQDQGLYVSFFREAIPSDVAEALTAIETPDDRFEVHGREMYWLRNGRLSDSPVATSDLEKAGGRRSSTMRNMNTVMRILNKFAS